MNTSVFTHTPAVIVRDPRGLSVRELQYHRHPDSPDVTEARITRHSYDTRGVPTQSADPRLHQAGIANFTYLTDLAGTVLQTSSADAGTSQAISDAPGRPVQALSADGTLRTWLYEPSPLPGRLLSITEQASGQTARITERFVYAGGSVAEQSINLAGQCTHHYDPAGVAIMLILSVGGVPLRTSRRLLKENDGIPLHADWKGDGIFIGSGLLDDTLYTTRTTVDATGNILTSVDATGNVQRMAYDVAGQVKSTWLTVAGGTEQIIVRSLTYTAAGEKLQEVHGNGVETLYTYEPQTRRLVGITTVRPAGHPGGFKILQDLRYDYDPVGNVRRVSNDAEATRFWRNQKVVPENTYTYDSLYQLVSATGREMANAGQQGSELPALSSFDSATYTNYTRQYRYDTGGNLTQIRHSAPAVNNSYTTLITVSDRSNRAVVSTFTTQPQQVDALFTPAGNQKQLLPGQTLAWNGRGELDGVSPVIRPGSSGDRAFYRYDSNSQRVLKVSTQKAGNSEQTQRVIYLPGVEVRTTATGSTQTEELQVITVGEAGRAQVRVLHWVSGKPASISNDQVRYSYDDLTGSSGLEVDGTGQVMSLEEYYPYGGTAVLTARSAVEVSYKTIRYSGKERDATGLYYYGYRYYQPWAGRWLSADPAGTVDGLNLFQMVKGNPGSYIDDNGLMFKRLNSIRVGRRERNSPNDISTVSDAVGTSESDNQSQLNVPNSKNELIINIIERLVGIVETGRGGMRTLQGEQFNETMTKLAALYIDLQPEGALSGGRNIMHKSKGFRRPPKDLVNQKSERGNLYDFMTPYLTRDLDSENFCLQNVTSDLHKWTEHIIDKQQKRLPKGKSAELLMRMNNAADPEITRAEFTKNPTSRPPEDQEEAIQFIYYMAGQFESESEWNDFARDMYADEYPQLKNVTYERAKKVFNKNKSLSVYTS